MSGGRGVDTLHGRQTDGLAGEPDPGAAGRPAEDGSVPPRRRDQARQGMAYPLTRSVQSRTNVLFGWASTDVFLCHVMFS